MYARELNGELEVGIPSSSILKDGRTVSNYNLLPFKELSEEGWKICEEIKPDYDIETQRLEIDRYISDDDKITVYYKTSGI